MNKLFATIAALLVVGCGEVQQDSRVAADEASIRELIRETAAMNNVADSVGWVALFEEGAVYMPPGIPAVTTVAGLREMASTGFGGYEAAINTDPIEIVVMGDWAFARSVVTGTVTPRGGGDAIQVDTKQLVPYRRQADGSWKIARMMNNANS